MGISWGIPVIVSILLLGFVGLEQSAAGQGSSFQQDQIAEIQEIIQDMQDELNNLHVTWANVTEKPVGFENDTNDDSFFGIFQSSDSVVEEPCDPGDVISWSGINWECIILPSTLSVLWGDILEKPPGFVDNIDNDTLAEISIECLTNQIVKWDGDQWNCTEDLSGSSSNTEFNVNLGDGTVTKKEKVLYEFKIVDLPSSDEHYSIPINHMILESNLNVVEGNDLNIILQSSFEEEYRVELFMGTQKSEVFFKTANHASPSKNEIEIEKETTENRFRIIAQALDNDKVTPATGNFNDLKLKLNLLLPGDASIVEIPLPPPSSANLAVFIGIDEVDPCGLGEESAVCTFVVSVTNIGPDVATDVVIYDNLSVGAISSTSTMDGLVDQFSLSELVWLIDVIPKDYTVTLIITAESSTEEPSITNTASVSSLVEVDPDPSNDSVEETKIIP